jgi:hypothetical protein
MQTYQKAVDDYDAFVEHPKGRDRGLELCYPSAQVVAAVIRVPEFSEDLNSEGEIKEWRRWIDIRQYQLHGEKYL